MNIGNRKIKIEGLLMLLIGALLIVSYLKGGFPIGGYIGAILILIPLFVPALLFNEDNKSKEYTKGKNFEFGNTDTTESNTSKSDNKKESKDDYRNANNSNEKEKQKSDLRNAYKILHASKSHAYKELKGKYLNLMEKYTNKLYFLRNKSNTFVNDYNSDFSEIFELQNKMNELEWAWEVININKEKIQSEEFDYKFCILTLCAQVMNADGKQMGCELERVKIIIRRYYKTEKNQKEALQKFKAILEGGSYQNDKISLLNKHLNFATKSELIMELLAIIYADNEFSANEDLTIQRIVKALNIKSKQYNSIYTIFMKKYRNGEYKTKEDNDRGNSKNEKSEEQNNRVKDNSISVSEAYKILGMDVDVPDEEIKKAYRALAKEYHPDKFSALGDEAIRQATATMQQINKAWDVVKVARGMK